MRTFPRKRIASMGNAYGAETRLCVSTCSPNNYNPAATVMDLGQSFRREYVHTKMAWNGLAEMYCFRKPFDWSEHGVHDQRRVQSSLVSVPNVAPHVMTPRGPVYPRTQYDTFIHVTITIIRTRSRIYNTAVRVFSQSSSDDGLYRNVYF